MLIRLLAILVLSIPSVSQATVDWTEGFEYATQGAMNAVWTGDTCIADTSVMTSSTTRFHDGSRSLRMNYNGHQGITPGHHGCAMSRLLNASTEVLYARWWMYMENFTTDSTHTKVLKHTGPSYPSDWWGFHWGGTALDVAVEGVILDNGTAWTNEYYGPPIPPNTWVCVETQETMSTPGVNNGIIRMWLGGELRFEKLDTRMRAATQTLVSPGSSPAYNVYNEPTATFREIVMYVQDGVGNIYIDDMAVSRDARIGCGSTPPPTGDIIAPSAPSTPTLTVSGGGQISLAWTNGTDAVGVTGTNILRCSGAACSPITTLTVVNSGATVAYADTSVASGTTYGYKLSNFDAAGNQSAFSAVAYATTGTSYKTQTIYDSFNRADSADLGASWDGGYDTFYGVHSNLAIVSNQLRVNVLNQGFLETYNATTPANDQWAQITFSALIEPTAWDKVPGIVLRANAPGQFTGYACRLFHGTASPQAQIQRWAAMVAETALASENTSTWQTGDKMRCEAEGTTIRLYQIRGTTETLLLSATDATYASGRVGMFHYIGAGTAADVQLDDFLAGDFSVSVPTPPAITGVTSGSRTSTTVTYTGTPTWIRVVTEFGSKLEALSAFPAGVYTFPPEVLATMTDWVCFYAHDALGVENTTGYTCGSVPYTFDTAEVVLSSPLPTASLPNGTTSTQITATVDKTAGVVCRYDTTDIAYASMQTTSAVSLVGLSASATVTGLTTGANLFYMRCNFTDLAGADHANTTSLTFTVTVAASTADVTLPSTVTNLVASPISNSQAELSWGVATDNVAVGGYNVYMSVGDGNTDYVLESIIGTTATRTIVNLLPSTIHNFVVRARDTSENLSAADSNVVTITTEAVPDITPPNTVTNLRADGVYSQSVVLTWDAPVDDRGAASVTVEMCDGAACSDFAVVASKYTLTQLIVALSPSTSYSFRVIAVDAANNPSAAYSNTLTITTNASGLPQPRIQIPFGVSRLPRS